jgi:hypothetical protein
MSFVMFRGGRSAGGIVEARLFGDGPRWYSLCSSDIAEFDRWPHPIPESVAFSRPGVRVGLHRQGELTAWNPALQRGSLFGGDLVGETGTGRASSSETACFVSPRRRVLVGHPSREWCFGSAFAKEKLGQASQAAQDLQATGCFRVIL